jgi:hypothetical protein
MFFRHQKSHVPAFDERIAGLREAGFQISTAPDGATRVSRGAFAADVRPSGDSAEFVRTGVLAGGEIGELTDLGFQKIWLTPSGKKLAATAEHLRALHDLTEDLRERMGMVSLYNEALGSVNEHHLYDRVAGRDAPREKRPWEVSLR